MARLDFAAVYDDQVRHVYGFFAYRLVSTQDVEDLTQLTFERALKAWPRYDPRRSAPGTWLMAIARNLLVDHFRRSHYHGRILDVDELSESLGHREDAPLPLGIAPELANALAALSDQQREILALRFGADLRSVDIARLTGLSTANVDQIASRSLRKLRQILDSPPSAQ